MPAGAAAQQAGDEVRIVARLLADDRIEFALQQRHSNDSWGDRLLPTRRFFPTSATVDRWLASSPLQTAGGEVRIVARRLADGRVEFALQQRHSSEGSWGERLLPTRRFFPTGATVGRWLASSPLSLTATEPTPTTGSTTGFVAVDGGGTHSCGLRTDGTIECWGNNDYGQATPPGGQFTAVTAASGHSCGLRTDGTIECWGDNGDGQATPPGGQFTAVTASGHSCGLRTDGTIECWGYAAMRIG